MKKKRRANLVHLLDQVADERCRCSDAIRAELPRRPEADGRQLACASGCAWCCHVKLITDVLDGLVAYRYLLKQGRWTRGLQLALLKADEDMCRFTHVECLKMLLPCVFLDHGVTQASVTGKCSIYAARPLACSVTFSYGLGHELCGRPHGRASFQAVPNTQEQYAMTRKAIKEYGLSPTYYTFPGAVLVAEAIYNRQSPPDVLKVDLAHKGIDTKHVDELFDSVALTRRGNIEVP